MRPNSRYVEIARQSLTENQPAFHEQLKATGKLEAFLAKRAKQAGDMVSSIHQRNLAAGVPPGTSLAEANNQAIRDCLLFESRDEQDSPDGYHDQPEKPPVEMRSDLVALGCRAAWQASDRGRLRPIVQTFRGAPVDW